MKVLLKSAVVRVLSPMLAVYALTACEPAYAQTAAQDTSIQRALQDVPDAAIGESAAKLVSRIRNHIAAAARYYGRLETASAEDSLVLQMQLTTLQSRAMSDIHELGDVLVKREVEAPQPELRAQVEALYESLTPYVWLEVLRLRSEVDDARARRPSAPVSERLVIEEQVAERSKRLDDLHKLSATHVEKMAMLGLDVGSARTALSQSLSDRADEISGRIDLALTRIDALDARLADSPDDADIPVLLLAAHRSLETNETSMAAVLDLMDGLGLATDDYRAQLVTSTRDLTVGLLDEGVAAKLLKQAWEGFRRWMSENGPPFVVKLVLFLAIMIAFGFASRVVRKAAEKSLETTKLRISTLLRRMIVTSLSNLVLFLGLLIALSQLGISLGPLLAGVGVAGFVIGFALQDSLSNFAAGLMILIYRPYDVGDLVDVGGVFGKVDKMSVVSTSILTVDNQLIMVPNSKIWGDVIKNVTAQKTRRVDMTFGISYSDDIPKAEKVLQDILKRNEKVLDDPEPLVRLHTLGESSVDFVVRPWVAVADYWNVYWDVTRAVKMRFDEEGISIPFPQRDLHVYEEKVLPDGLVEPPASARVSDGGEG